MGEVARAVRITGDVQGVGFRWACEREAGRQGVRGWVRNEPDGSVAAHLEGEPARVEAMVDWCRSGPPGARVERVELDEVEPEGADGFETRS